MTGAFTTFVSSSVSNAGHISPYFLPSYEDIQEHFGLSYSFKSLFIFPSMNMEPGNKAMPMSKSIYVEVERAHHSAIEIELRKHMQIICKPDYRIIWFGILLKVSMAIQRQRCS